MSIDKDTVKYVAKQAHLALPDDQIEKLAPELSGIMSWIEQLSELNTDNDEPLANVADINLTHREDKVTDGDKADDILANAPEETEGYFVVNKIVE